MATNIEEYQLFSNVEFFLLFATLHGSKYCREMEKIHIHRTTKTMQLYIVDYYIFSYKQTEKQSQILLFRSTWFHLKWRKKLSFEVQIMNAVFCYIHIKTESTFSFHILYYSSSADLAENIPKSNGLNAYYTTVLFVT